MKRSGSGCLGIAAILATFWLPGVANAVELASYRAVYDIGLDASTGSTGDVGEITGRVVTEFTGASCAGYTAKMRFVMAIENEDGGKQITDTRTSSFEEPAGRTLDFSNQTYIDEKLTSDASGKAQRTGQGITVSLVKPAPRNIDLAPSVIFPTQQVEQILAAAMEGKTFFEAAVYDGTDDGQQTFATAAVIGKEERGADPAEPATTDLGHLRRWPVTVSYFDSPEPGEQVAAQVMSFHLYENGIQGDIKISYGSFAIALKMTSLELLPAKPCP